MKLSKPQCAAIDWHRPAAQIARDYAISKAAVRYHQKKRGLRSTRTGRPPGFGMSPQALARHLAARHPKIALGNLSLAECARVYGFSRQRAHQIKVAIKAGGL